LNLRWNYATPIDLAEGEWTRAGHRAPALYVTNAAPIVKADFSAEPDDLGSVTLLASTSASVGGFQTNSVPFSGNGTALDVALQTSSSTPGHIAKETFDLVWKAVVRDEDGAVVTNAIDATRGHVFYTVLDAPKAPWTTAALDNQNPWASALDLVCSSTWAGGKTTINGVSAAVTEAINSAGVFSYDIYTGGVHYTKRSGAVDLDSALKRLSGGTGNGPLVNCVDCANLVASFANLAGAKLFVGRMGGTGFRTNPYTAIGRSSWTPPEWGAAFRFHAVAWQPPCGDSEVVFDACLRYDGDGDPTSEPRTEELPAGVQFSDGDPGEPWTYRERLAAPGSDGYVSCGPHPAVAAPPFFQ
ncbi:MAG: hypothetical protein IJ678_00415, partial [Kiritimatiellae bacterium]|nr:hypothetical protein [Kiritimatiellia bacterium]